MMSATGSAKIAPATGVPGRVGVKRTPGSPAAGAGAAGASGLNVIAEELGVSVVVLDALELEFGAATIGDGVVLGAAVSPSDGGVLDVELQPGLAKIRISAKRWMPTTMPKIFRIFIGGFG